jgi:hypothetical protein
MRWRTGMRVHSCGSAWTAWLIPRSCYAMLCNILSAALPRSSATKCCTPLAPESSRAYGSRPLCATPGPAIPLSGILKVPKHSSIRALKYRLSESSPVFGKPCSRVMCGLLEPVNEDWAYSIIVAICSGITYDQYRLSDLVGCQRQRI